MPSTMHHQGTQSTTETQQDYTVLICGDRRWQNMSAVLTRLIALKQAFPTLHIIHGGAAGADSATHYACDLLSIPVTPFFAEWDRYHRAAGPIRNKRMLVEGKPQLVIAFHHDLDKSKGTKNMVEQARKAGIPIEVIG